MKNLNLTAHASKRMQQRAISEMQVRLLLEFGEARYQKGGAHISFMPEKTIAQLRHAIDKLANVQVILGEEERVVTVMHEHSRIRKTQYAA